MTIIGFVRHGITDWNVSRRDQGQTDIPLNDIGRYQANAFAGRLQPGEWDRIVASDLSRARETAEIAGRALELPIETDSRFREVFYGKREGTTYEERLARWGANCESLPLDRETHEAAIHRGRSALEEWIQRFPQERILIFSHGELIEVLTAALLEQEVKLGVLGNTSLTVMQYANGRWNCPIFNDTAHLDGTVSS